MKEKLLHIVRSWPLYVLLLPVFFVLHGYRENQTLVPAGAAMTVLYTYLAVALLLTGLIWLFNRQLNKAAFLAFCLLCIQFFFGAFHDFLRNIFPGSFLTKYTFLLPALLTGLILLFILVKRKRKPFSRSVFFLNVLFLVFIITDLTAFLAKPAKPLMERVMLPDQQVCDTCPKPDIYLLIADGYPGRETLDNYFGFDNRPFEKELRNRGFYIADSSRSNYNFTTYSMASMLNMEYLEGIEGINSNKQELAYCFSRIADSRVMSLLEKQDYEIVNHSIFDLNRQPSMAIPTFLPRKAEPITEQTLIYRLEHEIGFHLATTLKLDFVLAYLKNHDLKNNIKLEQATRRLLNEKAAEKPRFVYTHLVMPHYPYYYDSLGRMRSAEGLTYENASDKGSFVSYLKYSNKQFLGLIDHILQSSPRPPVILLMSDHGFREFTDGAYNPLQFVNFNAVLLPGRDYRSFYPGMSNVNQFRALFNTLFRSKYPLLADSTRLIVD